MRGLLLVVLAALVLPAAAHAKELTGFAVCGPSECEDADVSGFGHAAPFWDETDGPPPGHYYRLELEVDGQSSGWALYYEPVTGLVAREDRPGTGSGAASRRRSPRRRRTRRSASSLSRRRA